MLEQIDYKTIFYYFEEISKVPRGSYHNEKISDYLVQFAKECGIAYRQEECGNVIFRKPASRGLSFRKDRYDAGTYGYGLCLRRRFP